MNIITKYILFVPLKITVSTSLIFIFISILSILFQNMLSGVLIDALGILILSVIVSSFLASLPVLLNCIIVIRGNLIFSIISFFLLPVILFLILGGNEVMLFCFLISLFYFFKQLRRKVKNNIVEDVGE